VSVLGYFYSSPFLESKFGIYDTCGVANLHGYPSVLGGLLSVLLVYVDAGADFLLYGVGVQSLFQLAAVAATLAMAVISGLLTGRFILGKDYYSSLNNLIPDYEDAVWWIEVE
jgi:ammonium transporter Rh